MHFLTRDESKRLEKTLRRQIEARSRPKVVVYYDSGARDYASAARLIVRAIGAFSNVTVLFQFAITGDGWDEDAREHEGWQAYRQWREAAGDTRRLHDAPGHHCEAGEALQLTRVVELALVLGWDALITAAPGRQLAWLSHDDRMEVYRGFGGRQLASELVALGYWHTR